MPQDVGPQAPSTYWLPDVCANKPEIGTTRLKASDVALSRIFALKNKKSVPQDWTPRCWLPLHAVLYQIPGLSNRKSLAQDWRPQTVGPVGAQSMQWAIKFQDWETDFNDASKPNCLSVFLPAMCHLISATVPPRHERRGKHSINIKGTFLRPAEEPNWLFHTSFYTKISIETNIVSYGLWGAHDLAFELFPIRHAVSASTLDSICASYVLPWNIK